MKKENLANREVYVERYYKDGERVPTTPDGFVKKEYGYGYPDETFERRFEPTNTKLADFINNKAEILVCVGKDEKGLYFIKVPFGAKKEKTVAELETTASTKYDLSKFSNSRVYYAKTFFIEKRIRNVSRFPEIGEPFHMSRNLSLEPLENTKMTLKQLQEKQNRLPFISSPA